MRRRVIVVVLAALLVGCASVPPAQVGQAAGTIAGAALVPGIGAPLGALIGMLAGMVLQGRIDQATETRERRELGERMAHGIPPAAQAASDAPRGAPVRVWMDETLQDGRLIAGHFDTRAIP